MDSSCISSILQRHVPPASVAYCMQLWQETPFTLKLTRSRQTKVGDFTGRRNATHHQITLNHDLNPYLFLITYIHEVAHLRVFLHFADRVDAHGDEWKRAFRNLLRPVMQENSFPPEILHLLTQHMINPKASSFSDGKLTKALREYDKGSSSHVTVSDLPEGSVFKLQGRFFRKGKLRRTRVMCREVKTNRTYLVPVEALVSEVQLSLL